MDPFRDLNTCMYVVYADVASGITYPEGTAWTADMMSAEVVAAQP